MKKLLLTAAAILATLNIYAQSTGRGVVNFSNLGRTVEDRVWVNDTGVVGEGVQASAAYRVALYGGAAGITDDRLLTQMGNAQPILTSGQWQGGNRTITGLNADGDIATIQVRGWLTADGATYEEALANLNIGHVGKNAPFQLDTEVVGSTTPPPTVGLAAGFAGFAITPVPEPSVIGLGLLGVGTLLMLRRRK